MLPTYVLKCKPGPRRLVWMNAAAVNEATNTSYETTLYQTSCGGTRLILVPRTGSLVQTVAPLI